MRRTFFVEVLGVEGLFPRDGNGSCTSFVAIEFNNQKEKTAIIDNQISPTWNETMSFIVEDMKNLYCKKFMKLIVYHVPKKNMLSKPCKKLTNIGQLYLNLDEFVPKGKEKLVNYTLQGKNIFSKVRGEIDLKLYYQDVGEQAKEVEPEIDDDTQSMAYTDTDIDSEPPSSPEHELVHPEPQQIQVYPEPQQIQVCANPMAYHKPQQLILGLNPLVRWIEDTRRWKNPMSTIIVHVLLVMYAWLPDLIVPLLGFYVLFIEAQSNRFRVRECVQAAMIHRRNLHAIGIFVSLCLVAVLILFLVPFKMVAMVGGFYYLRHPILRKQTYSPQRLNVGENPLVQWIEDTRGWKNPTATIFTHVLLIMNVLYSGVIVPVLGLYVMFIHTWTNRFRVRESVQMIVTSFRNNPRAIGILGFLCLIAVLILYLVPFKMVVMVSGFYYLRHPILRYWLHQLLRRFG